MRLIAWTLTLSLLVGCGWHLRGVTPLPDGYRVLYIQGGSNDIRQTLRQQLEFNGAIITASAADAPVQLIIEDYDIEKRTLSINSNGQVAEYELNAILSASIVRTLSEDKRSLAVNARRTLANDVNNVVATQQEETQTRDDLKTDLITRLIRRLQSLEQAK
jgi:LPS-assembly lipoprotein